MFVVPHILVICSLIHVQLDVRCILYLFRRYLYMFRVQRVPETCRPNDGRNKVYSVHLLEPELNLYLECNFK
jgi:hypothetical protein